MTLTPERLGFFRRMFCERGLNSGEKVKLPTIQIPPKKTAGKDSNGKIRKPPSADSAHGILKTFRGEKPNPKKQESCFCSSKIPRH